MSEFNPPPRGQIVIGGLRYEVMPHPAVETFAFGQEGRKAFVFQIMGLDDGERLYALKKFKLAYRLPELIGICDALAPFASIAGMEVCRRECLNPRQHGDILSVYPDLEYAVLMPWIDGSTWYDIVVSMKPLNRVRAVTLAWATAGVLAALEESGLAHCDLSSGNIIVNLDTDRAYLIDVEDLYAPGFSPPGALPAGSDGYAHLSAREGLWEPEADRFAGAILLAEMIAWHDPTIRQEAEDEHFFATSEMQQDTPRYWLMRDVLGQLDARLVDLFDEAWLSPTLADCPPLFAWAEVIEELYRQTRVAHVAPEWRPIVPANGADHQPAVTHTPPPEPSASRPVARPEEPEMQPDEAAPAEAPPAEVPHVESAPVIPRDRPPIDVVQPSAGGPLLGFRPLNIPSPAEPTSAPSEPTHRPIQMPEETSSQEPAFDALDVGEVGETAYHDEFEPLGDDAPIEEPVLDAADADIVDEDTRPGVPTAPLDIQQAAEPDESVAFIDEDPAEAIVAEEEPVEDDEATKPAFFASLLSRFGRKADEEPPPTITLTAPQLDLIGVDDDGRPILAWMDVPGAKHYDLHEAGDVDFSDAHMTRVRRGTQWQPRHSRYGTYFYRLRAVAGDITSAWSNVVRVRIKEE